MRRLRSLLLAWYRKSHRDLPWRATQDPYRIWLSEIMLQQTRVEAVLPYYHAFLKRFPDVTSLASAAEAEVLAQWSGLGYYSRARNLQKAARQIVDNGAFPSHYDGLLELAGIGDYTAAAVASMAFDRPHAAVDGNVLRVLARLFNDDGDIGSGVVRRRFQQLAQEVLDRRHPGEFNQAMMELGATVCVPRNPRCSGCPVRIECRAHAAGRASELPVKLRRVEPNNESIEVVVVRKGELVLLRQRPAGASRMAGFWELPQREDLPGLTGLKRHGAFRHTIVNTTFDVQVLTASVSRRPAGYRWMTAAHQDVPVTTVTRKALALLARAAVVDSGA